MYNYRISFRRDDIETLVSQYEVIVNIEAESEEEALRIVYDGEYEEEDVEAFNHLGSGDIFESEVGDTISDSAIVTAIEEVCQESS